MRTKLLYIAFDAANPLFSDKTYKYDVKVGPEDATYVDAYHTSGAKSVKRGAGDYERYGHVDFYPNGGVEQAGCPPWLPTAKSVLKYLVSKGSKGEVIYISSIVKLFGSQQLIIVLY